jgi:hypothetical protein
MKPLIEYLERYYKDDWAAIKAPTWNDSDFDTSRGWYSHSSEIYFRSEYRVFTIRKGGDQGTRTVEAPSKRLLRFQRKFLKQLDSVVTFKDYVTSRTGKSYVENAAVHIGQTQIYKADIKSFFQTVNPITLLRSVHRHHPEAMDLIADNIVVLFLSPPGAVTHLPTGAPTSPILANLACAGVDSLVEKLLESCKENGPRYTRYLDDMTFSFSTPLNNDQMSAFTIAVREILRGQGFELHPAKSKWVNPHNDKVVITGVDIRTEQKVNTQYINELRPSIDTWIAFWMKSPSYVLDNMAQIEPDMEKLALSMINVIKHKLGYIKQVNPAQYYKCIKYMYNRINKHFVFANFEENMRKIVSLEETMHGNIIKTPTTFKDGVDYLQQLHILVRLKR